MVPLCLNYIFVACIFCSTLKHHTSTIIDIHQFCAYSDIWIRLPVSIILLENSGLSAMLSIPAFLSQSTPSLTISETDSLYMAVTALHQELKSYAPETCAFTDSSTDITTALHKQLPGNVDASASTSECILANTLLLSLYSCTFVYTMY